MVGPCALVLCNVDGRGTLVLLEVQRELHFRIGGAIEACSLLLLVDFIQHHARLLVRVCNGVAYKPFIIMATMARALSNHPVTYQVLIHADDEIVLILMPAYYQGLFTT